MADCGNWQGFTPVATSWAGSTPIPADWLEWDACQEVPPTVIGAGIPDQVNIVGDIGSLDVSQYFNEGNGRDPVYTATGLPSGATISETGLITYDLLNPVNTNVVVTLSTGYEPDASNTFNWLVNAEVLTDGWATEDGFNWLTEDGFRWILE